MSWLSRLFGRGRTAPAPDADGMSRAAPYTAPDSSTTYLGLTPSEIDQLLADNLNIDATIIYEPHDMQPRRITIERLYGWRGPRGGMLDIVTVAAYCHRRRERIGFWTNGIAELRDPQTGDVVRGYAAVARWLRKAAHNKGRTA